MHYAYVLFPAVLLLLIVVTEIMACAQTLIAETETETFNLETETLAKLVETRPRRDLG